MALSPLETVNHMPNHDEESPFLHPYFPHVLATTDELYHSLGSKVVVIEVDQDPEAFEFGHIPTARLWNWSQDLRNPETGEVISKQEFESLMERTGISSDSDIVLYGDNNGWFACWAYWVLKSNGHERVRILDGSTSKWIKEGKPLETDTTDHEPSSYEALSNAPSNQAKGADIINAIFDQRNHKLIDARSKPEYTGEMLSPGIGKDDTCVVGGHIPTAINIPWQENCREDGTFKSPEELTSLYQSHGVTPDQAVITYCSIGERSSLSWFVLKELLGFEVALNYDRSMAAWSRMPNAPIVQGEAA